MSDLDARSFVVRQGRLVPADIMADELLQGIGDGHGVMVTIRRPRNPKHHRLLFAMIRKVMDNTDRWASEDALLDDLKLATGLFTTRINMLTKIPYAVPLSIRFASMSQEKFRIWFDRVIEILATDVLGCATEELRAEIMDMVEGKWKSGRR